MYQKEFDRLVQQNQKFDTYLFCGDCEYLSKVYVEMIAKRYSDSNEDIRKIYYNDYNFNYCLQCLSQNSLFSTNSVVVLELSDKIPKKDLDKLILQAKANDTITFIIHMVGKINFKSIQLSFDSKSSVFVRFFNPNPNEALNILSNKLIDLDFACDSTQALKYILDMNNGDIASSIQDIELLSITNDTLTIQSVKEIAHASTQSSLDDFCTNIFVKKQINKELYLLLQNGVNEVLIIGAIQAFVAQLVKINIYLKIHGALNIKEIWGYPLPANIANEKASIAIKYKLKDFEFMLNSLQDIELQLKYKKNTDTQGYIQASLRVFLSSFR